METKSQDITYFVTEDYTPELWIQLLEEVRKRKESAALRMQELTAEVKSLDEKVAAVDAFLREKRSRQENTEACVSIIKLHEKIDRLLLNRSHYVAAMEHDIGILEDQTARTVDERVEAALRETRKNVDARLALYASEEKALRDQLAEAIAKSAKAAEERSVFPKGFTFYYDGDPNYTPRWVCALRDASEKEVWRRSFSSERYSKDQAKALALEDAWNLVTVHRALVSLG